jgi:hypothetical protein
VAPTAEDQRYRAWWPPDGEPFGSLLVGPHFAKPARAELMKEAWAPPEAQISKPSTRHALDAPVRDVSPSASLPSLSPHGALEQPVSRPRRLHGGRRAE